ncbi:MAG: aminotransferase class III-fold pyridoxal phosphate-dependent enzyme, partial [Anaerovoracaceae bacterium]
VLKRVDNDFLKEVIDKGEYIREKILDIPQVKNISGMGLMLGVSIDGKPAAEVVKTALEEGLMILTAKDKVRLLPPLNITYEEIDRGVEILKKALA